MNRLAAVVGLACSALCGACFEPAIPEGYACGPDGACPPGQHCDLDGTCRLDLSGDPGGDGDGDGGGDGEPAGEDCTDEPGHDEDGDGLSDVCDNCPGHYNPEQGDDGDGDGVGDACDPNPASGGDVVLYFESFDQGVGAWDTASGVWESGPDDVDQEDAGVRIGVLVLRSVRADEVTVDTGAAIEAFGDGSVPMHVGPAVALTQGGAGTGYACTHMVLPGDVAQLAVAQVQRPVPDVLAFSSAPYPELDDQARYRITMADGEIACELAGDGATIRVSTDAPPERGQVGLLTAELAAEFEYVVVYGRK